jgi:uncharacterized RDD family membrane protein YckC
MTNNNSLFNEVDKASFVIRLKATLLDTIILLSITPIVFYNITKWKSVCVLILISLVGISYKILMEYKFGATFGKMITKIRVTNYEYSQANISEVLRRNIFQIAVLALNLFLNFIVFNMQEFENVVNYQDYMLPLALQVPFSKNKKKAMLGAGLLDRADY